MARITNIYRTEDTNYMNNIGVNRRQIQVVAGDSLLMLMDLNSKGLCIDSPTIRGKELEEFTRKYNLLSETELRASLEIDSSTFLSILNQCVQCVGCRRRVERLYNQLASSGHTTLDPLVIKKNKILTINEERLKTPQALGTLLYRHHDVLNNLLDSKLRNKTRCFLHSLDAFRSKPFSESWREVWSSMKINCRNELAVIDTKELQEVLENYLKKHKFCQGCRTKIEKAYKILVGECNTKEKGYVAALYANFEKCQRDKHIHVYTNKIDFLDALIRRAEPELNGSYSKLRERHAKTLEIAQEEVLTCVGMIMYDRLRCIYISLREEERACQVLAAVGVHSLCRSFDTFVETKQGISNLELLYQEISRAERAKEHRREQKKLKKKKKKIEKKNGFRVCDATATTTTTTLVITNDDTGSEGTREDDDDDADNDDDEAVDVSEMCAVVVALDDDYEAASIESNSDATEEENDINSSNSNINSNSSSNNQLNLVVPCQMNKKQEASKKKKRSKKTKKNKSKNTTTTITTTTTTTTSNNNQNKKKLVGKRDVVTTTAALRSSVIVSAMTATTTTTTTTIAREKLTIDVSKCSDCLAPTPNCPCDVKDSGYGSEPNSMHEHSRIGSELSSPASSEISCSDGFCNHEHERTNSGDRSSGLSIGLTDDDDKQRCENENCESMVCQQRRMTLFSLQKMLDEDVCVDEVDAEDCYIPQEVVLKYQCQREQVEQKRQKLRETLRQNFARLRNQRGASVGTQLNDTIASKCGGGCGDAVGNSLDCK